MAVVVTAIALLVGGAPASAQAASRMTSPLPADGVVGNGYLHQFTANLAPVTVAYLVEGGSLPPGTVLSPQGFMTGLPTAAGRFGPTTVCAQNLVGPPACQTFTITVHRRMPAILAAPSQGGPVGTPVRETASLVGAFLPTGSITFQLFRDPGCTARVFMSSRDVAIPGAVAGSVTSDDVRPDAPGTYRWTATYSGDANNEPVATPCSADNSVTITGDPASSTTTSSTTTTTRPTTTSSTTTSTSSTTTTSTSSTTTTTTTRPTTTTSSTTTTTTTRPTTTTSTSSTTTTTTTRPTTTSSTATSSTTTSTTSTTLAPTTTTTAPPNPDVIAALSGLFHGLFGP